MRELPYLYRWNRMDRKGQRCAVLARGTMNSCLVEFDDGFKVVTSRNAIRRAPADDEAALRIGQVRDDAQGGVARW